MSLYRKAFPIIPESVYAAHYVAGTLQSLFTPSAWARRKAITDRVEDEEIRLENEIARTDWTYQS